MSQGATPSPSGAGFQLRLHNLIGGAIVAVVGLALLGYAFFYPNTTIPTIMAAALGIIRGVVAIGMLPVQSQRDF